MRNTDADVGRMRFGTWMLQALAVALCATSAIAAAQDSVLRLVNVGAPGILGRQGNRHSYIGRFAMSHDARYTAFSTPSNNLVDDDIGVQEDVYVFDSEDGALRCISRTLDGGESNGDSDAAAISADGRWVVFRSRATNLVAAPAPPVGIYLHDRLAGETRLVTPRTDQGTSDWPGTPVISGDGRYVAFTSRHPLVASDADTDTDAYVYDRVQEELRLMSQLADGTSMGVVWYDSPAISADGRVLSYSTSVWPLPADTRHGLVFQDIESGSVEWPITPAGAPLPIFTHELALSSDGGVVAFTTGTALLPFDTNNHEDVYLFDRATRMLELASVTSSGALADDNSRAPSLSADALLVSFASDATNFHVGAGPGEQIYVHRRATRSTSLVSRPLDGQLPSPTQMRWWAGNSISGDGQAVALASSSDRLVTSDTNRREDIFIARLATGTIARASIAPDAPRLAGASVQELEPVPRAFASADGRHVVFNTRADNLTTERRGGLLRFYGDTGQVRDALIGSWLPQPEVAFVLVADGISDDGTTMLFRREPAPIDSGWPLPPSPTPRDLWVRSSQFNDARVDQGVPMPDTSRTMVAMMSGNARRIAFVSLPWWGSNDGRTGGVYVFEMPGRTLERVDIDAAGEGANASPGEMLGLSRNGRFLAFASAATNLVPENAAGRFDLYVRDLHDRTLARIVQSGSGASLVTPSSTGNIGVSDDGAVIAFLSDNTDLVPSLTDGVGAFRLDRRTGELRHLTQLALSTSVRAQSLSLNADGSRVAFASRDWSAFDEPMQVHVFDAQTGETRLESTDESLTPGDQDSMSPSLTADGNTLVFASLARNLDSTPPVQSDIGFYLKTLDGPSIFRSGFE